MLTGDALQLAGDDLVHRLQRCAREPRRREAGVPRELGDQTQNERRPAEYSWRESAVVVVLASLKRPQVHFRTDGLSPGHKGSDAGRVVGFPVVPEVGLRAALGALDRSARRGQLPRR